MTDVPDIKGLALSPSQVVLPDTGDFQTVLDFLVQRFPRIPRPVWESRMLAGRVLDADHQPVTPDEAFTPGKRIFYFREVEQEPVIPFAEQVIYQDDHILVVSKPHFLPVIPSGPYVNECLLNRLKHKTGLSELTPIHRIDRETAGLVVLSVQKRSRGIYQNLFMEGNVRKTYEAVSRCPEPPSFETLNIETRIVKGDPFFRMTNAPGPPNARSRVRILAHHEGLALCEIEPETGKKHQIRIHLSGLGLGIVNDRYYPDLLPEEPADFSRPLQLHAKKLWFVDPVSGKELEFLCPRTLALRLK